MRTSEVKIVDTKEIIRGRNLVQYKDLNIGGKLFGGTLIAWVDEQAAMFVMCQLQTPRVVTKAIDKCIFNHPVNLGDYLEYGFEVLKYGRTSITIQVNVYKRDLKEDKNLKVLETQMVFVSVDAEGRPEHHGKDWGYGEFESF